MQAVREILLMLTRRQRDSARMYRSVTGLKTEGRRLELNEYARGRRDEARAARTAARILYELEQGDAPQLAAERQRRIALCVRRQEFVTLEDGSVYFWPTGSPHGAMSAWDLRLIADEIERRNRALDARLRRT